jgi:hypothetical protein
VDNFFSVHVQAELIFKFFSGLAALLSSAATLLLPIVRTAIHQELQEFVQFDLRKIVRKFSKPKTKKKPAHEDVLNLLYVEDPTAEKGAKSGNWVGGKERERENFEDGHVLLEGVTH